MPLTGPTAPGGGTWQNHTPPTIPQPSWWNESLYGPWANSPLSQGPKTPPGPRDPGTPGIPPRNPDGSAPQLPGGATGGANQGAYDAMLLILQEYGLGSLAGVLQGLIADGITDQASLMLALQATQEWKTRFAGNEMLRQNGLGVLSVAEYLAVERSYAQILKNYGLPKGFYDDPSDFAKWIGNSVSANELQQRAQIYSDLSMREDPAIRDQLKSMGLTEGDIMAYTMDPSRAAPLIQRQYQTALIGGAARRAGVVGDNTYLDRLAGLGVTEQQAGQGYGFIGENLSTLTSLGEIYNTEFGQRDLESEVFENSGDAAKKRKRLASQERANFSGSSGIGQGSLTQDTSGSY